MITINTMKGTLVDRVFKGGEFNFKKKTMLPKDLFNSVFKCYEKIVFFQFYQDIIDIQLDN